MVEQNGGKLERFQKWETLHFIQIEKYFPQKFTGWYIESDEKIKNKNWRCGYFKPLLMRY